MARHALFTMPTTHTTTEEIASFKRDFPLVMIQRWRGILEMLEMRRHRDAVYDRDKAIAEANLKRFSV